MKIPSVEELFAAGAHYGHKTSRWHPKMAPFIYGKRGGAHIIDLEKTRTLLEQAALAAKRLGSERKDLLIVGTKKQASPVVESVAKDIGLPYVSVRWFGGMLTNFGTISKRVKHLKSLEAKMSSGELDNRYSKLEVQRFQEEIDRLNYNFAGIKDMDKLPGGVFVVDVTYDAIAVKEANKLGIEIIGICDTNADPSMIDYPVPANDDAIKSIELITRVIAGAYDEGRKTPAPKKKENDSKQAANNTSQTKANGKGGKNGD